MGLSARSRRPAPLWIGGLVAVLLVGAGVVLLVGETGLLRPDGQIAMDFLDAVEAGDFEEADLLAFGVDGGPDVAGAIPPTWPWHAVKIMSVTPDDSHHDYDTLIEASSADLTLSGTFELAFAVGTVDGREVVIDPFATATVTSEDGGELTAITVGGKDLGAGTAVEVALLPGMYEVTAIRASDGAALRGRVTAKPGELPVLRLKAVG